MKNKPITISNLSIQPGESLSLALPAPEIYSCARLHIPMHIIHGKKEGPILLVCSGMHPDEVNGVAIIQKLLDYHLLKNLKGTLIAIPVLNIYSLLMQSRNMPDQSDLEGEFPGSETGSFASRVAFLLSKQVFHLATHCIDLHSGDAHIHNVDQICTDLKQEETKAMALAFRASVLCDTDSREGLLSLLHKENPVPTMIYSTGEPNRLDLEGIRNGVKGIIRVMRNLGMLTSTSNAIKEDHQPLVVHSPVIIRSPCSGFCRPYCTLGKEVKKGHLIARISDPFGAKIKEEIFAPIDGVLISKTTLPLVHEGEQIFKIAPLKQVEPEFYATHKIQAE